MSRFFRVLKNETWRPVPDFPGYEVSDCGRVRSFKDSGGNLLRTPHLLRVTYSRGRQGSVSLSFNGCPKVFNLPALVLTVFGPPPPTDYDVVPDFLDGKNTNNRITNLFWRKGGRRKLTASDVKLIRTGVSTHTITREDAAKRFGVCVGTIHDIMAFRRWKNV